MNNGIVELKCYRFYPTNTECIVTAEIVKTLGEHNRIIKMQLTEGTKVPKTIEFTARGVSELKHIVSNIEGAEHSTLKEIEYEKLLVRTSKLLNTMLYGGNTVIPINRTEKLLCDIESFTKEGGY